MNRLVDPKQGAKSQRITGEFPKVSPALDQSQRKVTVNGKSYTVVRQIADTNFSVVSLVEDQAGMKKVAKEIKLSEKGFKAHELAEREVTILKNLTHPNIVKLEDSQIGSDMVNPILLLEYLDGQTISELVKKGERISTDKFIAFLDQMASAIEHAHSMHPPIIHRDIKPNNIMGVEDRYVLLDWGTVEKGGSGGNTTVFGIDNFGYIDPELLQGRRATVKSDIYSLAAVSFYLLTHIEPDQRKEVLKGELGDLKPEVRTVLANSLEHDSDKRPYESIKQFKVALSAALGETKIHGIKIILGKDKTEFIGPRDVLTVFGVKKQIKIIDAVFGFVGTMIGLYAVNDLRAAISGFILGLCARTLIEFVGKAYTFTYHAIDNSDAQIRRFVKLFTNKLKLDLPEKQKLLAGKTQDAEIPVSVKSREAFTVSPASIESVNLSKLDFASEVIVLDGKFTAQQAIEETRKQDMIILPDKVFQVIFENPNLREKYKSVFPCWVAKNEDPPGAYSGLLVSVGGYYNG